jgi:hypothetical protein
MFTATRDIETRRAHMDPIVSYFILEQCHQKAAVVNLFLELRWQLSVHAVKLVHV